MQKLYDWQIECLDKWEEAGHKGIAEVTTGAGKTIMAREALRRLRGRIPELRAFIVVPRVALLDQWKNTLKAGNIESAIYRPGQKHKEKARVIIMTINSAREVLPILAEDELKHLTPFLLILDEFHHYGSPANYHLFDFLSSSYFKKSLYYSLGLSATTDVRTLKERLIPAIGQIFYRYNLKSALSDNIVNRFMLFNIGLYLNPEEKADYNVISDSIAAKFALLYKIAKPIMKMKLSFPELMYRLKSCDNASIVETAKMLESRIRERRELMILSDERIKATLKIVEYSKPKSKIIVFTERIEQVDAIVSALKKKGYKATGYTSESASSVKAKALDDFKVSNIDILVCCRALDEGLDVPDCNIGIFMANTTKSLQRIQRAGRVIRKAPEKLPSLLYYLYLVDTVEDKTFLYDIDDIKTVELSFNSDSFVPTDDYYGKAQALIRKLNTDKTTREQAKEIAYLLEKGTIRPEQFLSKDKLEEMLKSNKAEETFLKFMILLRNQDVKKEEPKKHPLLG